jgi:hypothetical protein
MTRIETVLQAVLLGAVYSLLSWTVMAQEPVSKPGDPQKVAAPAKEELASVPTKAEAGLYSEAVVIEEQAKQAQPLKDGENLLPEASGTPISEKEMEASKS